MDEDIQVIQAKANQIYEKFKSYFAFQVRLYSSYAFITTNIFCSGGRQNILGGI